MIGIPKDYINPSLSYHMVIGELEKRKQEIIDNHTQAMIEINNQLVQSIDNGLKDKSREGKFDLSAFDKIKALFHISFDKGLNMDSQQRLELAKLYFELQRNNISAIMTDRKEGYESLLKSINNDIEIAKKRLRQIEDELYTTDKHERGNLEDQRNRQMKSFGEL